MVPFSHLAICCKETLGAGGSLTISKIVDIFAEADENMVEALIKPKVPLMHCVIPTGTGLFVPWGWITAEHNDNDGDSAGWRWTLIGDESSEYFKNFPISRCQKIPRVSNPTAQRLFSPKLPMHSESPKAALIQLQ